MTLASKLLKTLLFFFLFTMNFNDGALYEGFTKILGSITNVKIVQILNQLCNESQGSNTLERDACYGCFFRANSQSTGYPALLTMAACADKYLNSTNYGHCQRYLRNATNNINSRSNPPIIYCTFLECVRQVNKDALEALKEFPSQTEIGQSSALSWRSEKNIPFFWRISSRSSTRPICVVEAKNRVPDSQTIRPGAEPIDPRDPFRTHKTSFHCTISFTANIIRECLREAIIQLLPISICTSGEVQLAQIFVNTTACILAKTRCGAPNPITGAFQEDEITNKLQIPTMNAIQVNSEYDINIIQLPFGNGQFLDECAKYRNVAQASWPGVKC